MRWLLLAVLWVFFAVITAVVFGLMAQRLLGIRVGGFRVVLAGLLALAVNGPILNGIVSDFRDQPPTGSQSGAAAALLLLGFALTLLASMIFLVIMEAFVPLGSLPPPLVWGRGLRGRLARARRYWQVVAIGLRHGLGPYLRDRRRRSLDHPGGRRELGVALRASLNAGGVTFVKLGQVLSTRRDLLPAEVVEELSRLQDRAEPVPWPRVEAVLAQELGRPVAEVFASVDPHPLAAASVGQVHAARLASGEQVVVKIQRPGIRPVVERDLDIAQRLAARLAASTSWGRALGLRTLADGLATALREELDYRVEAENIQVVARAVAAHPDRTVRVLTVYPALCTERVLVMERLDGTPLNAVDTAPNEADVDRPALARALLDFLLRQILTDGVFHADPHAGNVLLLTDGRLGLLDLGSVGRLDAGLREAFGRLLAAIDRGDPLATADALLEIVPRPDAVDGERLERDLGRFLARHLGATATGATARMFGDLFRIVAEHGLAVPAELAAVLRALGTAEGTLNRLDAGFDFVAEARTLAAGYATEQFHPVAVRETVEQELVALLPMLRRLPRRLERIAGAIEHGRLTVSVRMFADERDREVVAGLVHRVLLAFLAAATGVVAVLLLGTEGGPVVTPSVSLYQLLGYQLLVISSVLALRVLVVIFRTGRH